MKYKMASKGKHHYVPRLYLKQFASCPRQINICVLKNKLFRQNVSLKDQCQRPKFYGKTDDLENDLMKWESAFGPTIDTIVSTSSLPAVGSQDQANILLFTAFQAARTPLAVEGIIEAFEKLYSNVKSQAIDKATDYEQIRMQHEEAVLQMLNNAAVVADFWTDLQMHLVLNNTQL